jgi:hypothetical protein
MSSVEGETISHRKTNKKQVLQYLQLWTMKLCFQVRLTSLPVLGSFKDWKVLLSSVHRYVTGNAAIGPYRKYQINTYITSSQASLGKNKTCSAKYITLILLCLKFGRLYKKPKYPMHSGILSGSGGVYTLKGCHLLETMLCMYLFDNIIYKYLLNTISKLN